MRGMDKSPGDRQSAVDLGKYSLIRYNSHGHRFEMIVDPELAWLYQQGEEDTPLDDIYEGYTVFDNFSKGQKASDDDVEQVFGTSVDRNVAKMMLQKGELQITQEQRRQFVKEKRDEIVEYLVANAVNPRTKSPHPAERIENAIFDAGIRIDRKAATSQQAKDMIPQLEKIIPIKIESATIEFVVPPKDTGPLYGFLQGAGDVVNENWGTDGTLTMLVRVPAGRVAPILEEISDKSKGRVRSTVVDRSD